MKVIIIDEENHGFIGVADSVIHAIDFLIEEHWLTENSYIYQYAGNGKWTESSVKENSYIYQYAGNGKWTESSVKERFGDNWAQTIKQFNREKFNDEFEGSFYLSEETVYIGED